MQAVQIERFQLERDPFPELPDGLVLKTPELGQRVALFIELIETATRPILLVGEPGAGRSTFLDILAESLPASMQAVAWRASPGARPQDLLLAVSQGFGVDTTLSDLNSIALGLAERLEQLQARGTLAVLLVDDADALSEALFELLAGLDRHTSGALHLVLAGTHGLGERSIKLAGGQHRGWLPVIDLPPLTAGQAGDYLNLRLAEAGWVGDCPFDDDARTDILRASGGRPGALNRAAGDWLAHFAPGDAKQSAPHPWRRIAGAAVARLRSMGLPRGGARRRALFGAAAGGVALVVALVLGLAGSGRPVAEVAAPNTPVLASITQPDGTAPGTTAPATGGSPNPGSAQALFEPLGARRPVAAPGADQTGPPGAGSASALAPRRDAAAATVRATPRQTLPTDGTTPSAGPSARAAWSGSRNAPSASDLFAASLLKPVYEPPPRPLPKPPGLSPIAAWPNAAGPATVAALGSQRGAMGAGTSLPRPRPPPRRRATAGPAALPAPVAVAPLASTGYVIQLVAFAERDRASQFVTERGLGDKAALYPVTGPGGKVMHAIVLQGYPSRDAAVAAIQALPSELRNARPWIRPVGSVLPNKGVVDR